jgi:hypothetical protein
MMLPFTDLPAAEVPRPARLAEMHAIFGVSLGNICGDCMHFHRYQQSTRWQKCDLTRQTAGPGTDWRVNWTACGRYTPRETP